MLAILVDPLSLQPSNLASAIEMKYREETETGHHMLRLGSRTMAPQLVSVASNQPEIWDRKAPC
jgi:hypothetical protein